MGFFSLFISSFETRSVALKRRLVGLCTLLVTIYIEKRGQFFFWLVLWPGRFRRSESEGFYPTYLTIIIIIIIIITKKDCDYDMHCINKKNNPTKKKTSSY